MSISKKKKKNNIYYFETQVFKESLSFLQQQLQISTTYGNKDKWIKVILPLLSAPNRNNTLLLMREVSVKFTALLYLRKDPQRVTLCIILSCHISTGVSFLSRFRAVFWKTFDIIWL